MFVVDAYTDDGFMEHAIFGRTEDLLKCLEKNANLANSKDEVPHVFF
jgi:hypothetical protein